MSFIFNQFSSGSSPVQFNLFGRRKKTSPTKKNLNMSEQTQANANENGEANQPNQHEQEQHQQDLQEEPQIQHQEADQQQHVEAVAEENNEGGEPHKVAPAATGDEGDQAKPESEMDAEKIKSEESKKIDEQQQQQQAHQNTEDKLSEEPKPVEEGETIVAKAVDNKHVSVGTSTVVINDTQEVVSSTSNSHKRDTSSRQGRPSATSRRSSYQSRGGGGSYSSGSFQNYGLTYLPYKSNFEPSEDARRRADEFLKTLKL